MATPVFRFAPSPNGYLHLGHALSALLNFDMARAVGGKLLLRIEDIDETRCLPEYEQAILDDLAWLGIAWERPVRRQSRASRRLSIRARTAGGAGVALPELRKPQPTLPRWLPSVSAPARGRATRTALRFIRATRRSIAPAERKRRIEAGERYALRLDMAAAIARTGAISWTEAGQGPAGEAGTVPATPAAWGDVVLARKETPTSYHLSVVVDDAIQGVTHVVRGQDLFFATGVHRLLQSLLGLPIPAYHHHRLLLDADGRKLSKSTQATGLRELRAQGAAPADIRRMVGLS